MYIIMKIYSAKTDDPNGNSKILCLKHKYMYHYGRERNRNYMTTVSRTLIVLDLYHVYI